MRSKVLEIAYVSTPASPTSSVFTTGGIVSSLTFSWHETQAVYSVDFQPLPISQLKRLLHTGTDEEGVKGKDAAATPTSKEKDRVDGGMSTPVASTSGSAVASGGAVVARSYRMATAGGDSKVRVSPPLHLKCWVNHATLEGMQSQGMQGKLTDGTVVDGAPKCPPCQPCRAGRGDRPRVPTSPAQDRISRHAEQTYGACECRAVQPERSHVGFRWRW
jgi:chromatin assembly factor 1 subunit B